MKLQYCNVNTHKLYLGCVVSFYRKRYSGLPSLQNKCFLFLILLNWHFPQNVYFLSHQGTFLLNPELPNVSKFSRDVPTLLHQNYLVQISEIEIPRFEVGCLLKDTISRNFWFVFFLHGGICYVNLGEKNPYKS